MDDSETAFAKARRDVYLRAKTEAGYNATYFLRMLSDHGPIDTARRLITSTQPSEGFTQLWQRGRLDLTVEATSQSRPGPTTGAERIGDQQRRRLLPDINHDHQRRHNRCTIDRHNPTSGGRQEHRRVNATSSKESDGRF
jgi:hypothetical protein